MVLCILHTNASSSWLKLARKCCKTRIRLSRCSVSPLERRDVAKALLACATQNSRVTEHGEEHAGNADVPPGYGLHIHEFTHVYCSDSNSARIACSWLGTCIIDDRWNEDGKATTNIMGRSFAPNDVITFPHACKNSPDLLLACQSEKKRNE
jgi:hypothetical protein